MNVYYPKIPDREPVPPHIHDRDTRHPRYFPPGVKAIIADNLEYLVGIIDDETAIKFPNIDTDPTDRYASGRGDMHVALDNEAKLYKMIGAHKNIVKFKGRDERGLLMEWATNGSLYWYLKEHASDITLLQRLTWAQEAAEAIAHIHSVGVIHGDVKPSNFVLDKDLVLKLIDFEGHYQDQVGNITVHGFASYVDGYCMPRTDQDITAQRDIFALGITIHDIIAGHQLFPDLRTCTSNSFPNISDHEMGEADIETERRYKAGEWPVLDHHKGGEIILKCLNELYDDAWYIAEDFKLLIKDLQSTAQPELTQNTSTTVIHSHDSPILQLARNTSNETRMIDAGSSTSEVVIRSGDIESEGNILTQTFNAIEPNDSGRHDRIIPSIELSSATPAEQIPSPEPSNLVSYITDSRPASSTISLTEDHISHGSEPLSDHNLADAPLDADDNAMILHNQQSLGPASSTTDDSAQHRMFVPGAQLEIHQRDHESAEIKVTSHELRQNQLHNHESSDKGSGVIGAANVAHVTASEPSVEHSRPTGSFLATEEQLRKTHTEQGSVVEQQLNLNSDFIKVQLLSEQTQARSSIADDSSLLLQTLVAIEDMDDEPSDLSRLPVSLKSAKSLADLTLSEQTDTMDMSIGERPLTKSFTVAADSIPAMNRPTADQLNSQKLSDGQQIVSKPPTMKVQTHEAQSRFIDQSLLVEEEAIDEARPSDAQQKPLSLGDDEDTCHNIVAHETPQSHEFLQSEHLSFSLCDNQAPLDTAGVHQESSAEPTAFFFRLWDMFIG